MRIVRQAVWLLVIGYWVLVMGLSGIALAKDDVGTVVAVKGKTIIDRDKRTIEAKIKDSIFFNDMVSTLEASRAKMLFIDDSILTLGEKSKVVINEFIYSKDKGGRSIINLIDGKMRSIVGKTKFEVHTPTAVAAARGTMILFEIGVKDGKKFTTIVCQEGETYVRSPYPGIVGSVTLGPGMMITVFDGEPLPSPVTAPAGEADRLLRETDISPQLSIPAPPEITVVPGGAAVELPVILPPIEQQPPTTTHTPVTIDVIFPPQ
ncbi:MAG: FecR family protein [Nitrospirota bacterium]